MDQLAVCCQALATCGVASLLKEVENAKQLLMGRLEVSRQHIGASLATDRAADTTACNPAAEQLARGNQVLPQDKLPKPKVPRWLDTGYQRPEGLRSALVQVFTTSRQPILHNVYQATYF